MSENGENLFEDQEMYGNQQEPLDSDDMEMALLNDDFEDSDDLMKIRSLEEEQEMLTSSLIALTSHFAQVQFRLRQIVEAPAIKRDLMLRNLEEFAFKGIPEIKKPSEHNNKCESQQLQQQELLKHLKSQLEDIESYTCDSGSTDKPQTMLFEKQKIIIDELKNKINFNVEDLELLNLSTQDLRKQVDTALGEFVGPHKMNEQLVSQLKTQVQDLERFITFLQNGEQSKMKKTYEDSRVVQKKLPSRFDQLRSRDQEQKNANAPIGLTIIQKASSYLHMLALSQFGCGLNANRNIFQKNTMKKTFKGNHWGDIRAQLEVDVREILSVVVHLECITKENQEAGPDAEIVQKNHGLVALVRKNLSRTIQRLMEHGLKSDVEASTHMVPFISGCFMNGEQTELLKRRRHVGSNNGFDDTLNDVSDMHAWELVLEYYNLKNGVEYNSTPAMRLSESFNLDIVDDNLMSSRHSLLKNIGKIISIHGPYKRSYDSHLKAFICAGLNVQKLTQWLNLIMQSKEFTCRYYTQWSYVANTGFRDSLKTLDLLTSHKFDLPIDVAVKHLQNIKDIFI